MKESFIILFVLFPTIFAECCRDSYFIQFDVKDTSSRQSCSQFQDAHRYRLASLPAGISMRCGLEVCGDGRRLVGTYCGAGSCNIFGCNCDGGCLSGDPVKEFHSMYGDEIQKPFIVWYL
nr:venom peptide [Acharia stimulea]